MTTPSDPSLPEEAAGRTDVENLHIAPHVAGPAGTGFGTERGGDPDAGPAAAGTRPGGETA